MKSGDEYISNPGNIQLILVSKCLDDKGRDAWRCIMSMKDSQGQWQYHSSTTINEYTISKYYTLNSPNSLSMACGTTNLSIASTTLPGTVHNPATAHLYDPDVEEMNNVQESTESSNSERHPAYKPVNPIHYCDVPTGDDELERVLQITRLMCRGF